MSVYTEIGSDVAVRVRHRILHDVELAGCIKTFFNRDKCSAWSKLGCLKCQTFEEYDELVKQCFEDVTEAVDNSVKGQTPSKPIHVTS